MAEFKIDVGKLNKRITIQKYTVVTNENGFDEEKWIDYKPIWSAISNLFGREYYAAMAVQAETTVEFVVRYSSELEVLLAKDSTKLYRVFWHYKVFNITFVDNIQYQNKWLKIKTLGAM